MAQKDFFETALLPDVNMGVTNLDAIYSWETNVWRYAQASQGFLAKALTTINFHEINSDRLGGLFKSDDKSFKTLIINQIYVDFMKAYCVSLYQGSNPSGAMVYAHQMLLKRVYVRMVMSGIETHPANITSELLQQATDMLAQSRTGNTAITNASKDYDDANVIAKQLNYLGITLTPLEIKKKQKGMATNTTTAGKIAKKSRVWRRSRSGRAREEPLHSDLFERGNTAWNSTARWRADRLKPCITANGYRISPYGGCGTALQQL